MKTIKRIVFLGVLIITTQVACVRKTNSEVSPDSEVISNSKVTSDSITYKINRKSEMTTIHSDNSTTQGVRSFSNTTGAIKIPVFLIDHKSNLGKMEWTFTVKKTKTINKKSVIDNTTISKNKLSIDTFNILKVDDNSVHCVVSSSTLSEVLQISNKNDSLSFSVEGVHNDTIIISITDHEAAVKAGKKIFYKNSMSQIQEDIKRINGSID